MTNNLLPRRSHLCVSCQTSFKGGDVYHSFCESIKNEVVRTDLCTKCYKEKEKRDPVGEWQGKIPIKVSEKLPPDTRALLLLKEKIHQDPKLGFVLVLYLQRRGQLERRKEGLYEEPSSGDLFSVPRCSLSSSELDRLKEQVSQLFHG